MIILTILVVLIILGLSNIQTLNITYKEFQYRRGAITLEELALLYTQTRNKYILMLTQHTKIYLS